MQYETLEIFHIFPYLYDLVTILVTTLLHPNKELSTQLSKLEVNGKPNLIIFCLNSKKRVVPGLNLQAYTKFMKMGPMCSRLVSFIELS